MPAEREDAQQPISDELARGPEGGAKEAQPLGRRRFLHTLLAAAGGTCLAAAMGAGVRLAQASPRAKSPLRMKKAKYWKPLGNARVQCTLCPKKCKVGDRERGFCGVRENRSGVYYTLVYGSAAAARPDPIEKKPFFHFLPGTLAFSIATAGCNMNCRDCQNWNISQSRPEQIYSQHLPPADVARYALRTGCKSIAYTYNEPVIFYEYMYDTAVEGHKRGVRSVIISNGYINREPLLALLRHLDAVKIDLKGFSDQFYRKYCSGTLSPVLDTIKTVHRQGKWLEIVYLVVPGINDSPQTIEAVCKWIRDNVGRQVPLHFSRFYPHYQLRHLPPTPYATLQQCHKIARSVGLHYVYIGNVPDSPAQHTYCPACGKLLIERMGYIVRAVRIKSGRCPACGHRIPGVWA